MGNLNRFGDDFPFAIDRKATDSDEYYKGLCQGAKVIYEMLKAGMFEDGALPLTYFSHESNRSVRYEKFLGNCEEDDERDEFIDKVYQEGFDDGVHRGIQMAQEEMGEEIYIDAEKVCKLDQLHNEILELGRRLHPSDIDILNSVLKRVVELKYDMAKDAIDEYLGYK